MNDFPLMFSHHGKTVNVIGKKRVNTYKKLYTHLDDLQKEGTIGTHENYLGDNIISIQDINYILHVYSVLYAMKRKPINNLFAVSFKSTS